MTVLRGSVPAPTVQMVHNQVLPGKYNTKASGPVRPGTTDHTDISKPVYGIRTVPAYIIVFPSPYEIIFPSPYEIHRNPYGARI